MTNTENAPTFPRNHEHCMDRTGVNYVPCTSLTHCPSICDCPVSACTAEIDAQLVAQVVADDTTPCPYCEAAPEHATNHANGEHGTIHPDAIASITNGTHIIRRIDALTEQQRRDALVYLSGADDDRVDGALRFVTR